MTALDPRVGEIENRLATATPGPWEVDAMDAGHSRYEMNVWITAGNAGDTICDMDGLNRSHNEAVAKDDGYADAKFIANAPADVSYLLAELRKAREALERVEARADRLAKSKHCEDREIAEEARAAVAAAKGDERDVNFYTKRAKISGHAETDS